MLILKIRQVADVEFNGIEKVHEGAFIDRYNVSYTTQDQRKKVYEIISRNKDLTGIILHIQQKIIRKKYMR